MERVLKGFEAIRLRRICASMDAAARNDKTFHLWWHPHNFGVHLDENMSVLYPYRRTLCKSQTRDGLAVLDHGRGCGNVLRAEKPHCVA